MKNVTTRQLSERISWDQLFDGEEELIKMMMTCETEKGLAPRGYGYIRNFKQYYKKYGRLTPKQLTQLKRLAKAIYAFVNRMNSDLIVRI